MTLQQILRSSFSVADANSTPLGAEIVKEETNLQTLAPAESGLNQVLALRETQLFRVAASLSTAYDDLQGARDEVATLKLDLEKSKSDLELKDRKLKHLSIKLQQELNDKEMLITQVNELEDELVKERRKAFTMMNSVLNASATDFSESLAVEKKSLPLRSSVRFASTKSVYGSSVLPVAGTHSVDTKSIPIKPSKCATEKVVDCEEDPESALLNSVRLLADFQHGWWNGDAEIRDTDIDKSFHSTEPNQDQGISKTELDHSKKLDILKNLGVDWADEEDME